MVTLRTTVVGSKELQRKLERMDPGRNKRIMRNTLLESAFLIQKDAATKQIRHGARKSPPVFGQLTNRHGGQGLVGSIKVDRGPLPFAIEAGTDKLYGALHEFGLGHMPKRPFMQPALDDVAPKFGEIVVKHWKREARL